MIADSGHHGTDTRTLLIDTAERLFALRGVDAVSSADIRKEAGQRNASVISYYFGSKNNLLKAILDHRLPVINARRHEMLQERLAVGREFTVRDALWCTVQPLAENLSHGNHYVGLLDKLIETGYMAEIFGSADPEANSSAIVVDRLLVDLLDHLPEETRRRRIHMVYGSMLRTLAFHDRSGTVPDRVELSALIDAWEGLLLAPVSVESKAAVNGRS